jgi:hypothetical protein
VQGSIFTSERIRTLAFALGLVACAAGSVSREARADIDAVPGANKADTPEEDDFSGTPYTNYGEFNNQEAEEDADEQYFQYGRFFGLSLGLGYQAVTGNRGLLWQGGFPMAEFKLHYWFDFHFALTIDVYSVDYFYTNPNLPSGQQIVNGNLVHLGVELKYYFDVKDMSSTITFANPYIIVGAGPYTRTETTAATGAPTTDTEIGLSGGAGLEFAISPKKVYFEFEGRLHYVPFSDTNSTDFSSGANGIPNLNGQLITLTGNILFTW